MQFFTVASLFAAAALAAPAPQTTDCPNPAHCGTPPDPSTYENIDISDYTLRLSNGEPKDVSFKFTGNATDNGLCASNGEAFVSNILNCKPEEYKFSLVSRNETNSYGLAFYHQTSQLYGLSGDAEEGVPTTCEEQGEETVCKQKNPYTIVIAYPS